MVALGALICGLNRADAEDRGRPIRPLAQDYVVIYRSPSPKDTFCYSPGIARLPSGRLIATMDMVSANQFIVPNLKEYAGRFRKGQIFTSDDGGATWTKRHEYHMTQARPFVAGKSLYVIGQLRDLKILRSDDDGITWSPTVELSSGQSWHQAPCNVHYAKGNVYLVMERKLYDDIESWSPAAFAPVLMRAKVGDDLTQRSSWTFASELAFRDAVKETDLDFFGVPFFATDPLKGARLPGNRKAHPMGWCETNIVQFVDPNHYWFDPTGTTFHLFMRANTNGSNYGALAKVVENDDGTMTTSLEKTPSGRKIVFLPLPGGQMKFHILYDEQTRLYWLLSSQATDSMTRTDVMPKQRVAIPNNERHRLQLHFSKNCVDWCFAGIVATGATEVESRHYASMAIDGDDLVVLSRSGDDKAKSAHDGNMITFHRIKNFRSLVY